MQWSNASVSKGCWGMWRAVHVMSKMWQKMLQRLRSALRSAWSFSKAAAPADEAISIEEIRRRGEQLLEIVKELQPSLDFDQASIEWLDGYFGRIRETISEESRYGVALGLGYVLGETMRRQFGGIWAYDDEQQEWLVVIGPPLGKANPILKAYRHLSESEASIASMLRITRLVAEKGGWDKIGLQSSHAWRQSRRDS